MPAGHGRRGRAPLRLLGMVALVALLGASALHLSIHDRAATSAATVAATRLVDQDGARTSLEALRGRLVVLNFIYTGCGRICPVQTEQLARVQRALPAPLRNRVHFLSISVDPAHDGPETLKRFAELHGADLANWSFVTGEPAALERLAISFAAQPSGAPTRDHSADIRLFNPDGLVVQRYSGAPLAVGRLVADIRQLAHADIAFR